MQNVPYGCERFQHVQANIEFYFNSCFLYYTKEGNESRAGGEQINYERSMFIYSLQRLRRGLFGIRKLNPISCFFVAEMLKQSIHISS